MLEVSLFLEIGLEGSGRRSDFFLQVFYQAWWPIDQKWFSAREGDTDTMLLFSTNFLGNLNNSTVLLDL